MADVMKEEHDDTVLAHPGNQDPQTGKPRILNGRNQVQSPPAPQDAAGPAMFPRTTVEQNQASKLAAWEVTQVPEGTPTVYATKTKFQQPVRWTAEEDLQLRALVEEAGTNRKGWAAIAKKLGTDRSETAVKNRWHNVLRDRGKATGPWTAEEDLQLRALVEEAGTNKKGWAAIAKKLGTDRSETAVKNRWHNVLQQRGKETGPWTAEEDLQLRALVEEAGTNKKGWAAIAKKLGTDRSETAVAARWHNVLMHVLCINAVAHQFSWTCGEGIVSVCKSQRLPKPSKPMSDEQWEGLTVKEQKQQGAGAREMCIMCYCKSIGTPQLYIRAKEASVGHALQQFGFVDKLYAHEINTIFNWSCKASSGVAAQLDIHLESADRVMEIDIVENFTSSGAYHQDNSREATKCRQRLAEDWKKPFVTFYVNIDKYHTGGTTKTPSEGTLWTAMKPEQRTTNLARFVQNILAYVLQHFAKERGVLDDGWSTMFLRGSSKGAVTTSETLPYMAIGVAQGKVARWDAELSGQRRHSIDGVATAEPASEQ